MGDAPSEFVLARYQCCELNRLDGAPVAGLELEPPAELALFKCLGSNRYIYIFWKRLQIDEAVLLDDLRQLDDALSYFHNSLLPRYAIGGELFSPDALGYAVIAPTCSHSEIDIEDFNSNPIPMPVAYHDQAQIRDHYIPKERLDFLVDAERGKTGRNRIAAYVRGLEAAFACDGPRMAKFCLAFLNSNPDLPEEHRFKRNELNNWITLRHRMSHADKKENWVHESETWETLPRARQALYDCVFNKSIWNEESVDREINVKQVFSVKEGKLATATGELPALVPFAIDRVGRAPVDLHWLDKIRTELGVEKVGYLDPLLQRFPDLSLVLRTK